MTTVLLFFRACLGLPPQNYMLLEHKLQKNFLARTTCNGEVATLKKVALMNGTSKPVTNRFCAHGDDVVYPI